MEIKNFELLNNPEVIKWCYEGVTDVSMKNKAKKEFMIIAAALEKKWGNKIMNTVDAKQWTTILCQNLVIEALIKLGRKNVRRTRKIRSTIRDKKYNPDIECDEYVYEVKGRTWCTSGTAGEKILGVPLKYGEIPKLYSKPLKIVLVGYQEYEARESFAFGDLLDSHHQTQELHAALEFYRKNGIEYIGFTDILKSIGYDENFWNEE